ncbi:nucleotide pyrophosphohydrolase [Priestia koreensis]|nr:nucleotide pyrophosphohydrolase [Priestia koreensis]
MSKKRVLANMKKKDDKRGEGMAEKTMQQLQKEVDTYISQFKEGYFSPLAMLARMTEELGELSREINHFYGEKPKKKTEKARTVEEEMGDVLFVLICFANSLNIDLQEAHDMVMEKFNTRDKDRWTKIEDTEGESTK